MKEKVFALIAIVIFLVGIYIVNVEAAEYINTSMGFYVSNMNGRFQLYLFGFNIQEITEDGNYVNVKYAHQYESGTNFNTLDDAKNRGFELVNQYQGQTSNMGIYGFDKNPVALVYSYNMPWIPNTDPDPDPMWYEDMWDTFIDYFTNPVPFQWFKNLINRVFDDDEETTISDGVSLSSPTLTPAPTPIPYNTVVIPKTDIATGDTYYETNYIYTNPSGTPIVQPYPPTSAPSSSSGNGSNNYRPVDGKPLSLPKLEWLNTVTIGESDYDGIQSISDGLSSVDDIGSEYTDGISAVSDATSVLPTNWLMLIGIAAAIPLLAGIISRFLN